MGIWKGATPGEFANQAGARLKAGHRVHTVVWEGPRPRIGSVNELSDVLEAIEGVGWSLDRMEVLEPGAEDRPKLLLVFRVAPVSLG